MSLHHLGFFVSAVNPLLIRDYNENTLRKVKTDNADAVKIARYTLSNWETLRQYTPEEEIRYLLKTMNTQYQLASKTLTAHTNNLIALMEQTYPGVKSLFSSPARSDGSQKWMDYACTFWHVDCVCSLTEAAFTGELDLSCYLVSCSIQFLLGHDHGKYIHDDCQCDYNYQNINNRADVVRLGTVVLCMFPYTMNHDKHPLRDPDGKQKGRITMIFSEENSL